KVVHTNECGLQVRSGHERSAAASRLARGRRRERVRSGRAAAPAACLVADDAADTERGHDARGSRDELPAAEAAALRLFRRRASVGGGRSSIARARADTVRAWRVVDLLRVAQVIPNGRDVPITRPAASSASTSKWPSVALTGIAVSKPVFDF